MQTRSGLLFEVSLFAVMCVPQVSLAAVTITSPAQLPQATAGAYYSQQLTVSGGSAPYLWDEAYTPTGMTLSSAGVLSGTPVNAGDFAFTTRVADSKGAVGITLLKLTVAGIPLRVATTAPIAPGVTGVPYSQAFTTTGGKGTVRWSVPAGAGLPKGFSLSTDGMLTGNPSSTGTFTVTLAATDAAGTVASASYQLTVSQPDGLIVSAGSLSFTAFAFGSNPPAQNFTVLGTSVTNIAGGIPLPFSARADVPWITLTPNSGTTPATVEVNVFPRLIAGNYSADITVTGGNAPAKTVHVTLTVLPAFVAFAIAPSDLKLYGTRSSTALLTGTVQVTNTGGSLGTFTANIVGVPGATVSPASGAVLPNGTVPLTVTVDPRSAPAGLSRGRIEVNWPGGSYSALVYLQIGAKPKLFFSNSGGTASAVETVGLIGPAGRSFSLSTSDGSRANFTAKVVGSAPWLTLGTTTGSTPATITYSIDPRALSSNAYSARIRVTSPDVLNSPQDYIAILKVSAADLPVPSLFPAGLAFNTAGATAPPAQSFLIYTNSGTAATLQLGINTLNGGNWLSATAASRTVSTTSPVQVQVTINPSGLARGFYRGKITAYVGGAVARSESILLVVGPAGSENVPGGNSAVAAACTPGAIAVVQTALEGNFFLFTGFPGTVTTKVLDDCGSAVPNAAVVASFSNGDAPLGLRLSDGATGTYSQTWVPTLPVAGMITTVTATAPGLGSSTEQIGGNASPNTVPMFRGDGPLHIFNPRTGASLAPGTLLQIYGSGLGAPGTTLVDIGGFNAPLLYVGDGQINAQVPFELAPGEYQIVAAVGNALTDVRALTVDPMTPGVAGFADGTTIAQHAVDFTLVTASAPVHPNEFVILYLAGLGPTVPPVATGDKAPLPPAVVIPIPQVTLDGKTVQAPFAGLSPGLIGVYQINFIVPADAQTGNLQLQVIQGGVVANTSLLPVAR